MTQEFLKSIVLEVGGMEEITLAFGPHPSGILAVYQPVEVPTEKLVVQHVVFPTPDKPGAPIIELVLIKPVKFLEEPATFKILHKYGEQEEFISVAVKTLLLAEKQLPVTK